ncbi:HK97 family phage prohead protease, partial [Acetobacter tropicalis]|uniref:HK97 family phage prohead protease n=1 Tax=Acetobacter tropicalis TaxID=104102 RepID=UPI000587F5F7
VEDGWVATVEFVPEDYPYIGAKAEAVRRSIKDGFLSAVSIGFIPKEWNFNDEGGLNILESELTEFSVVSVPCHQDALVTERTLTTNEPLVQEDMDKEEEEEEKIKEEKRLKYKQELKKLGF